MAENTRPQLVYLRAWRLMRGYSQSELSELSSVAQSTIAHLETGATSANFRTIGKLAEALGITREQLMKGPPPDTN